MRIRPFDYDKSEAVAKMAYSISDFSDQDPRFLPRLREHLTKNPDQDLERCKSRFSHILKGRPPCFAGLADTPIAKRFARLDALQRPSLRPDNDFCGRVFDAWPRLGRYGDRCGALAPVSARQLLMRAPSPGIGYLQAARRYVSGRVPSVRRARPLLAAGCGTHTRIV